MNLKYASALLALIFTLCFSTIALADTTYTVQPGDTLYAIARRHNTTVSAIMQANGLVNPNLIYVGQQLTIPDGSSTPATPAPPATGGTHTVRAGETLYSIGRLYGVSTAVLAQANGIINPNLIFVGQVLNIPSGSSTPSPATPIPPTPAPPNPVPPSSTTYVVQPGDTLNRIAIRFGVTLAALIQANNILNPNFIYVGQTLNIPGGSTSQPPASAGLRLGGQTQTLNNPDAMRRSGMEWVKFQYKWKAGDRADAVASMVNKGHGAGFKVLLSITGAQTYPQAGGLNFGAYTEFLRGVASLSSPPDAIEVWNEANIDFEWPAGQISPTSYVNDMLAPAYNAIKGANNTIWVISGAPAPTGFDNTTNAWADDRYMRGMAAAGGGRYMDCIGIHHNSGATAPSATSGHPGGSHYSWYYTAMVNTYSGAFGGGRPLCFTELGYLSAEGFPGLPQNFAWASGNSVAEQAAWLGEAVQLARNDGRVAMLIVYNVDLTAYDPNGDPQAGYAMIRPNGSCPACDTLNKITGGR